MKRTRICNLLLIGLCISALTGCGLSSAGNSGTEHFGTEHSDTEQENSQAQKETDHLLDSADMAGTVLDFSGTGCSVSQMTETDGGAGMMIAAEGSENKDTAVSVTYSPDCEFVIAALNIQAGTIANVTNGSIADVKKNSTVYIYGEFTDTLNFNAEKVVITRTE